MAKKKLLRRIQAIAPPLPEGWPNPTTRPRLPELEFSTRASIAAFLCGCSAVLGLAFGWVLMLVLGLCGWSVMLLSLLQFRMTLREYFDLTPPSLRFYWDPERTYRAGRKGQIELELMGPACPLEVRKVLVRHAVHLKSKAWEESEPWRLEDPDQRRRQIELEFPVAGRFAVFGAEFHFEDPLRLFRMWRYVFAPTWLRVMPSVPMSRSLRRGKLRRKPGRQQQGMPVRRAGQGSDLRDLREYQPGDSRRSIVWKHSLRHRKLLCREFESEVPLSVYLLLDIGQSMREGELGQRKLDYAIEVVSAFAKQAIQNRDSVGLITFDGEVYRELPASNKSHQMSRLLKEMEGLHRIVETPFSTMPLKELCALVGRFLFREGLLATADGRRPASARVVVEYVWDYLSRHPEIGFPKQWNSQQDLISLVLRNFCRGIGLEIPYHYHQWVTHKAQGLSQAVERAVTHMHGGQMIVVLSDLGDVLHWEGVLDALRLARQHRHHLMFLSPFSPWFLDESLFQDEAGQILQEIFTLEQWTWRHRIQRLVGKLGIPVLSTAPEDAPSILLQRLQRLRLGGR